MSVADSLRRLSLPGALVAVGAFFRIYQIDRTPAWIDEANSILTASLPVAEILEKLRVDSSPPLYYLLLHLWIQLAGDSVFALRLLSTGFGVALVALVYAVGKRWYSEEVGLWAGLIVAVAPVQIFQAHQVRMYTLLPLLALCSVDRLAAYLRDGRRRDLAGWLAATVLALYTHNFAFHLLPLFGVLILLSGQLRTRLPIWIGSGALVALLYAPWIPTLLEQIANEDHYAWFRVYWEAWGLLGLLRLTFLAFSPGGEFSMYNGIGQILLWKQIPAVAFAALAAFGAYRLFERSTTQGRVAALWPTVYFVVPIASASIVSLLLTPHYVPSRVDQLMYPAYALLVASGLAAVRRPAAQAILAVALVAIATISVASMYLDYTKRGFDGSNQELAESIGHRLQPEDVIVTTSLTRAALRYYLGQRVADAQFVSFPRSAARHLGAQNEPKFMADPAGMQREARTVLVEARERAQPHGKVFLVVVRAPVNRELVTRAAAQEDGLVHLETLGHFLQAGSGKVVDLELYGLQDAK